MKHEERLELAKRLINQEINRTLALLSTPEELHTYAWGWRNSDTVGNNHGDQFFHVEEVTGIVNALRLNYTLILTKNEEGEPTPGLLIF